MVGALIAGVALGATATVDAQTPSLTSGPPAGSIEIGGEGTTVLINAPNNTEWSAWYGADGRGYAVRVSSGVTVFSCNPPTFGGDPAPNVPKTCHISGLTRTQMNTVACAVDYGTCTASSGNRVYYGAALNWNMKVVGGSVECSPTTFGSDPAPNVLKSCFIVPGGRLDPYVFLRFSAQRTATGPLSRWRATGFFELNSSTGPSSLSGGSGTRFVWRDLGDRTNHVLTTWEATACLLKLPLQQVIRGGNVTAPELRVRGTMTMRTANQGQTAKYEMQDVTYLEIRVDRAWDPEGIGKFPPAGKKGEGCLGK